MMRLIARICLSLVPLYHLFFVGSKVASTLLGQTFPAPYGSVMMDHTSLTYAIPYFLCRLLLAMSGVDSSGIYPV